MAMKYVQNTDSGSGGSGGSQSSNSLEDRVNYYLANPSAYTDSVYASDPEAYLAAPVYKQFQTSFGRAPTSDELSIYSPLVVQLGHQGAMSEIAKQHYMEQNTPEKLAEKKRAEDETKASGMYGTVNDMFKASLGRDATTDEQKHFATQMAQGVDAYTINQFLQALPENVKKQDEAFRTNLNKTLQTQDSQYYQEQIAPALQAMATKQGRSLDSSGVNNSLALAAQQQNRQRESYLANITAQQYGNSQNLAQQNYQQAYGNYQNTQDYNNLRNTNLLDQRMGRLNGLSDYAIQSQAYNNYLAKYGKRGNAGLQGALGGATAGATAGSAFGPWGAAVGGVAGGVGGYFGAQG